MVWALELVPERLELDLVVDTVLWLLLMGADEDNGGGEAELLHPQTVTVTVTGQLPVAEALLEVLLELDVCQSAHVEEALP